MKRPCGQEAVREEAERATGVIADLRLWRLSPRPGRDCHSPGDSFLALSRRHPDPISLFLLDTTVVVPENIPTVASIELLAYADV